MKKLLVTGGAGFIGSNAAHHFARNGWHVTVIDNLSRKGAPKNLEWLLSETNSEFIELDIRDREAMDQTIRRGGFNAILHLAGQVAVTTSVLEPREDFEINALGSLNLLESVRRFCPSVPVLYASTNKVYGKMERVSVTERNGRYEYESIAGATEHHPLDFHSPYGCSKGAADQYFIDYARIYGMNTVSFRQSCIYGPRQFGVEDQGWVAWFIIAATLGRDITIYGDGKQVRDLLHVADLVRLYELALEHMNKVRGQAFNVGGGPSNALSLLEFLAILRKRMNIELEVKFDDWRAGDQPVFICDLTKVVAVLGWQPTTAVEDGVARLIEWVRENKGLFP